MPPVRGRYRGHPSATKLDRKREREMRNVTLLLATLATLILTGCTIGGNNDTPFETPDRTEPAAAVEVVAPEPDDFTLSVRILEKHCFNTAGCNITWRLQVVYDGPQLDPDHTWEVTYEVLGGEDVYIGTITVGGDGYEDAGDQRISTPSSSTELDVAVLEVGQLR